MEATTIQLSSTLLNELKSRKLSDRETYEDIIFDLLEDTMELSGETKADITKARKEIKAGEYYTLEEMKSKLKL